MPSRVHVMVTLVSAGATYEPPADPTPEPPKPGEPKPGDPETDEPTPLEPSDDTFDRPEDEADAAVADYAFDGDVSGGCTASAGIFPPVVAAIITLVLRRRK